MSDDFGTPQQVPPAAPMPAPIPQPEKPAETGATDERTLAMLAHLLGIVTGFIAALIIWLTAEGKPYAKAQAQEALNFQITVTIAWVAAWALSFVVIGFVLLPVIGIANLVFCIIAGMAANKGDNYRYPFTLRLIK